MLIHWLLIAGGIAVFNALFIGAFLLVRKGSRKNWLLGMLFIALALRTGKSVAIILFPSAPDSLPAIGLLGMAAIGPLLYFYLFAYWETPVTWDKRHLLHLIFPAITALLLLLNSDSVVYGLYVGASVQLLSYLIYAGVQISSSRSSAGADHRRWWQLLFFAVVVHWFVYTSQIFIETAMAYTLSTAIVALLLYGLLFGFTRWQKVIAATVPISLSADRLKGLDERLVSLMNEEKIFTQPGLTLSGVASRLEEKPYVVSGLLNRHFRQTFPEFVNRYRVAEAKQLLVTTDFDVYTIEGIGFACGYNTPSAFYASFKSATKLTPSQYREKYGGAKLKST